MERTSNKKSWWWNGEEQTIIKEKEYDVSFGKLVQGKL